jgi:hypothetical protein
VLAMTGALGCSCSDTLEEHPSSYVATEDVFESTEKAQLALNGVYASLAQEEHMGCDEIPMPSSDDMYYANGTNSDGAWRDMSHYTVASTNTWLQLVWQYKYIGINRANHVIGNVRTMSEYGDAETKRIEGEALFLRALLNYDLLRYWGSVPLKTEYTDSYENAYVGRSSADAIYDQIIADLNAAKGQLKWVDEGVSPERASQGAARALLMRVYMQRSGYRLDSETGEFVRPDDATRRTYWQEVINEYNEIKGHHSLYASYEQYWKNFCEEVVDGQESIYEVAFHTPDGKKVGASRYGVFIGPLHADDYASGGPGRANGNMRVLPEWTTYYDDDRQAVNIVNSGGYFPGKWRRDWIGHDRYTGDMNTTNVNFSYLRYADVLLMAAEAYAETDQTAAAISLINEVRSRAHATELEADLSNFADIYQKSTSKRAEEQMDISTFKNVEGLTEFDGSTDKSRLRVALFWERGFELCFEMTRKYDLIRWGIMNDAIQKHLTSKNQKGYNALRNFTSGKHELFPIPLVELQQNTQLAGKNNPGY